MKYKSKICFILILLVMAVVVAYAFESYFEILQLEDKVIRLHILANSDTLQDQDLKLKVRNNIIENFSGKLKSVVSKKDSEKIIHENLNEIRNIAQQTVYKEGYYYDVRVFYDNYEFPVRQYEDFTLPEGDYDTVRVEIGEANGKNWWCVMFPPLCFMNVGKASDADKLDEEVENRLKEVLTEEEIEIIRTNRGYSKIKLKSKLYEIIRKIMQK
ncbi:stage II sporulation protein R [Sedimentibacter sp. zth1]|uniref:stage II sporulation protein R n=1 Tax=Sedimentibacter sp. zth1 TaxID=2816908 RepID=UPI001A912986|nr:stage II sporulation protein R [Sedimentibacter sp. zth1]QSX05246.1 stage II sporulation protein R [Sedimentibacter sp. zth1]